jgi:hypothetical protein
MVAPPHRAQGLFVLLSGHFVTGYTAVFGFSLVYNRLILNALTPLSRAKSDQMKGALKMFNLIVAISATQSGVAKGAYLY